jgi:hypothetical protein
VQIEQKPWMKMADFQPPAPKVQPQDLKGKVAVVTYGFSEV